MLSSGTKPIKSACRTGSPWWHGSTNGGSGDHLAQVRTVPMRHAYSCAHERLRVVADF